MLTQRVLVSIIDTLAFSDWNVDIIFGIEQIKWAELEKLESVKLYPPVNSEYRYSHDLN